MHTSRDLGSGVVTAGFKRL